MNRHQLYIAGSILLASFALTACAADGGVAGNGKPIDKEQTRVASCDGAQKFDIAFQGLATAAPGVIPAKVMDVEGGVMDGLGFAAGKVATARDGSMCAKVYAGDINVAINTAIKAAADIAGLIAKWKQT